MDVLMFGDHQKFSRQTTIDTLCCISTEQAVISDKFIALDAATML